MRLRTLLDLILPYPTLPALLYRTYDPQENISYIKSALSMHEVVIVNTEDGAPPGDKKKADLAVPGKPSYHFYVHSK